MAEIRVEPEAEYHARKRRWAAWVLVPVALMTLAVPFMFTDSLDQATAPGAVPPAGLAYQGHRWAPSGATLAVPDRDMVRVGTSREGRALFVARDPAARGLGGGGGPGDALPAGRVYVRVGEGAYQPLVKQ